MNMSQWANSLEKDEKSYVSRCFREWKRNSESEPTIPDGISKPHADVLRYHTKALLDTTQRRRKMEDLDTVSFKLSHKLHEALAMAAAEVDVNVSIFIRTCLLLAIPQIAANPKIINFFSESVIPK